MSKPAGFSIHQVGWKGVKGDGLRYGCGVISDPWHLGFTSVTGAKEE